MNGIEPRAVRAILVPVPVRNQLQLLRVFKSRSEPMSGLTTSQKNSLVSQLRGALSPTHELTPRQNSRARRAQTPNGC